MSVEHADPNFCGIAFFLLGGQKVYNNGCARAGIEPQLMGAPVHKKGSRKYQGFSTKRNVGGFTASSFPGLSSLPSSLVKAAVKAANNSLTVDTWRSYGAVKGHLVACQLKLKRKFVFPMNASDVIAFVSYLLEHTSLKSVSINNTLSSLRMFHLTEGHFVPNLRPDIVKLMLRGKEHDDCRVRRKGGNRLPMTLSLMELLRLVLEADTKLEAKEKSLIWAVSCICFCGSFRVGELLSKRANTIDPDVDLLKRDITVATRMVGKKKRRILEVCLKSPKEAKSNPVPIKVEVFEMPSRFCPVTAYLNYVDQVGVKREDNAAFRLPFSGAAYRHQRFNLDLKRLLKPHVRYGSVSGHSFRAGLSTLMAKSGFKDADIQAIGRYGECI